MRSFFRPLNVLAAWSLVFVLAVWIFPPRGSRNSDTDAGRAVTLMSRAIDVLRQHREKKGPPIDARFDLNRTGLVGVEFSPMTTSLGLLEAKRTTANPEFAGAVVRMYREAGLVRGDFVAVGASGSFPGLILASLCAAESLGLRPLVISSLGASNWGGNHPDWTWREMSDCLLAARIINNAPIAYSLGGDRDIGADMTAEGRRILEEKIGSSGRPFLRASDLKSAVEARLILYEKGAGNRPIKAFVNIGGSYVDMGTDGEILKLRPGFNPAAEVVVPPVERRGLIQEMARRGIPVIHLLYVKGLCDRYGLPWDPFPLLRPEASGAGPSSSRAPRPIFLIIYLAGMLPGLVWLARSRLRLVD